MRQPYRFATGPLARVTATLGAAECHGFDHTEQSKAAFNLEWRA